MLETMQPYILTALGTAGIWQFFAKLIDNVKARKLRFVARSLAEKVHICRSKGLQAGVDISTWPEVEESEIV